MERIVGKTVARVEYKDPWLEGLTIVFTDGTTLHVSEYMQAGEILVKVNGEEVESERQKDNG